MLAFVVHVAAVVLAVTGIRKVVDPAGIVAALDVAGLPSGEVVGRCLGLAEVGVGVWVLVGGGTVSATAMALLYGGFVAFIVANRVRGLDVPCGCIGTSTAPPGLYHVAIDLVGVVAAAWAVIAPVGPAADWADHGAAGLLALVGVVAAAATVAVGLEASARSHRG
ncbi:MAG: MauE/DoxX family redox-associated membrane protein [Acidimicrobiales bacterium]